MISCGMCWRFVVSRPVSRCRSGECFGHHVAMHVGQPPFDAIVVVRQFFVIDAEEVQHRGVKVVPGNRSINSFPADLVGAADRDARPAATTCHPAAETVAVVVAAGANGICG